MKTLLNAVAAAAVTSASFLAKSSQSVNVAISVTGTVSLQYDNNGTWIELQSITATTRYDVPSNMNIRCVVTANAGVISATLV